MIVTAAFKIKKVEDFYNKNAMEMLVIITRTVEGKEKNW